MGNPQLFDVVVARILVEVEICPGCGERSVAEPVTAEIVEPGPVFNYLPPHKAKAAASLGATHAANCQRRKGWGRIGSIEACGACVAKAEGRLSRG